MNKIPTREEVLEKFNSLKGRALFLEFWGKLMIDGLPFEEARKYYKDSCSDEEVREFMKNHNKIYYLKQAKDYVGFAIGKAESQRGISANRSIAHFIIWFWLAGEKEFSDWIEKEMDGNYHSYGIHILLKIKEKLEELL